MSVLQKLKESLLEQIIESRKDFDPADKGGESPTPTPYAVFCRAGCVEDGAPARVFMTQLEYSHQMVEGADSGWVCPRCRGRASFDEETLEKTLGNSDEDDGA